MKILHISAGGKGERIAPYISTLYPSLPKHLLPIPVAGSTLLGQIIYNTKDHFDTIIVWTNKDTHSQISCKFEKKHKLHMRTDSHMSGPLGPVVRSVLSFEGRSYGCAGDFYCDFSWLDFELFHDSHSCPISLLVARSVAAPRGARFFLEGDVVNYWERVGTTKVDDYINIGCYIIDHTPEVCSLVRTMCKHKEDEFFDIFIPLGMVAGFDPGVIGYNINTKGVYESLMHFFSTSK